MEAIFASNLVLVHDISLMLPLLVTHDLKAGIYFQDKNRFGLGLGLPTH